MRVDLFEGGPFAENTLLLTCESTGARVLVDPGHAVRDALQLLDDEGAEPEAILLTHAHLDHVEGIPLVLERWPDLPVRMHPADFPYYQAVDKQAAWFGLPSFTLPDPVCDLEHDGVVRYGEELEFEVRFAPGHAPGHVIFVHETDGLALVGDVVFRGSIGRTDLPGGDHGELLASISREVLTLPEETRLIPGHGPETTVSLERGSNPFLRGLESGDVA